MLFIKIMVETCYEIIFESIGKAHMGFKCFLLFMRGSRKFCQKGYTFDNV